LRSSSMIRMELITLSAVESFLTLDNVFMLVMIELRIDKYKDNLFTISIYK
jgi:predicted tellurium resistance membrane protein TerC